LTEDGDQEIEDLKIYRRSRKNPKANHHGQHITKDHIRLFKQCYFLLWWIIYNFW